MEYFWTGFEKRAGIMQKMKDFFAPPEFREETAKAVSNINKASDQVTQTAAKIEEATKDILEGFKKHHVPKKINDYAKLVGLSSAAIAGIYGLSRLSAAKDQAAQREFYRTQNDLAKLQRDLALRQSMMNDFEMRQRMNREKVSKE